MQEDEIVMILALVALVAVCLYNHPAIPDTPPSRTVLGQDAGDFTQGPAYLMANSPWLFAPPVGNVLPVTTAGLFGQVSPGWGLTAAMQGIAS